MVKASGIREHGWGVSSIVWVTRHQKVTVDPRFARQIESLLVGLELVGYDPECENFAWATLHDKLQQVLDEAGQEIRNLGFDPATRDAFLSDISKAKQALAERRTEREGRQ